jgi:hypothetical protein
VTEDEARRLLLSIDPRAALAETQQQLRGRLQELVPEVPEALRLAWEATAHAGIEALRAEDRPALRVPEQFAVLIPCSNEAQQVELLARFLREGLECQALLCRYSLADGDDRLDDARLRPGVRRERARQLVERRSVRDPRAGVDVAGLDQGDDPAEVT